MKTTASEVTPHLATLWMHILVRICKIIKLSLQIFLFGALLSHEMKNTCGIKEFHSFFFSFLLFFFFYLFYFFLSTTSLKST